MSNVTIPNPPYQKRTPPQAYEKGYFSVELGNIQRAIPSQQVRTFIATSTAFTDVPSSTDHIILYDATAHAITVNFPLPSQAKGLDLTVKRINAGANTVTLVCTSDGVVNRTLSAQYKSFRLCCDGITYYLLASI